MLILNIASKVISIICNDVIDLYSINLRPTVPQKCLVLRAENCYKQGRVITETMEVQSNQDRAL